MKNKLAIFILILITFLLKINVTNAADYVDTEHGVTCKYKLDSNAYNLIVGPNGNITQSASGSKESGLSSAVIKVTFYDKKQVSEYNFADATNIQEFVKFEVENPSGAKVTVDNKSKFTAFKANKGYAIQTYNSLRTCGNMYFVYYKSGNTYHIVNMLQWHYAGVGTAEGTQEVEINKVFDPIKSNNCDMATDSHNEKVCIYSDIDKGNKFSYLYVNIKSKGSNYGWTFDSKFYGPGLTDGKNDDGSVTSANTVSNFKCTAYVNNVKTSATAYNCVNKLYYYYDTGFNKWYISKDKPSKPNVRTLVLRHNYNFVVPTDLYKMLLVSHGDITSSDNSENRVPTEKTTDEQLLKYCKENPNDKGCKSFCQNNPQLAACQKLSFATHTFHFCEDKGILKTLKIVHYLLVIAKIIVPLLLIVLGSVEFGKASLSGNADDLEKVTQSFITKLVVGLAIFLIPTVVDSLVGLAQSKKDVEDVKTGDFSKCAACFTGAKACSQYIANGED